MSEIILQYTRAGHVENIHRGDVVAVNCRGELLREFGNGRLPMFWRSAAKPFQALAFVKNGGLEKYGLTDRELALLVSSHSGEPFHVELVEGILAKLGLSTAALNCGAARPMSGRANAELIKKGERPQAVHNACSGKHSQILALCQMMGLPVEGYIKPDHPAEKVIFQHVAMASCMPEDKLEIGIDGCGVPVFYLPLDHMARAYARLGSPDKGDWGEYEQAAFTIRDAMAAHPDALAGTGRIDTAVSQITGGRIIAKIGADAVYCMAVRDEDMGIAFKVEDGSYGAVNPAVLAVLKYMDVLTRDEYEQLAAKYPPVLKNHRGDVIGTIEYML
ncbi:MAG: asparaginase [Anaerovibrio sp.]|nr:asparaginase [Anaerovibrio sp.]